MTANDTNEIPFGNIRVDKNGVWYFHDAEMFRKDIVNLFYENLRRDESGRYIIELGNDRCYIEVEDSPYVVKAVYTFNSKESEEEVIYLLLNNEDLDQLDPATVRIGADNVMYCSVKDNCFTARFSRASYYQLADFIRHDEDTDSYYIFINNEKYYINSKPSTHR
ncbi:MAG: DUF1285 domain-containing protein [Deltaproteobacteria bacterium]|nr:DUF1285 domain-containing protein [Deltaproteobacteria bacterium]